MTGMLDRMDAVAAAKPGDRYRTTELIGTLGGSSVPRLPADTVLQVDVVGGGTLCGIADIGDKLQKVFIRSADFPSLERVDPS